ncbi:MAG: hypothetical protein IKA80_02550 [Spirochaetaceae bacterium]|nr:hypothetical protein [Spirochaetaceae bacterium]MBR2361502.1 hypothetical protein [Spirochaetaceae bacterium]
MSTIAFSELENQIEALPLFQIALLKKKIDNILEQNTGQQDFEFDSLVRHTERADCADEYVRTLRDNDRF